VPLAPNRIERAHQILRWLQAKYTTPYPTALRWHPRLIDPDAESAAQRDYFGDTQVIDRRLVIRMSKRTCATWSTTIDTLLHEYAHCLDWRHARIEAKGRRPHGPEWGMYYAALYEAYHDLGGALESREW